MAKAKGKLISTSYGLKPSHGTTVTVELERGMKVIGTCRSCMFLFKGESSTYGHKHHDCLNTDTDLYSFARRVRLAGCGLWKARKK